MQIAFISPVSVQRWTQDYTFYYMALLGELQYNPAYAAFFREICGVPANFITLNCYDSNVTEDVFIRWIRMLRPSEVVLPDIKGNRKGTVQNAVHYHRVCKRYCNQNNFPSHFMGVPQGETLDEWFACLHDLLALPYIDTIGISSHVRYFTSNRLELLPEVRVFAKKKYIHLLGTDYKLDEIKGVLKDFKWVRSTDTKKVARLASRSIVYPNCNDVSAIDESFFSTNFTSQEAQCFRDNMHYIKKVLGHYDLSRG